MKHRGINKILIAAALIFFASFICGYTPSEKVSAEDTKGEFVIVGVKGMYFHSTAKHFLIEIEVPDEYGLEVSSSSYAYLTAYGRDAIIVNGTIDLYDLNGQTIVMHANPYRSNVLALYIWPEYQSGERAFTEIKTITFKSGFSLPGIKAGTLGEYELKSDVTFAPTQSFSVMNSESGAPIPFYVDKGTRAVLFYDCAGNVLSVVAAKVGSDVDLPKAPEIDGLEFKGWDHSGKNISETTHIHPIYEVKTNSGVKTTFLWITVFSIDGVALIAAVVIVVAFSLSAKKKPKG